MIKIHLLYQKRKVNKEEIISSKDKKEVISRVKNRVKKLHFTHIQARVEFLGFFVSYPVYNAKPIAELNEDDLTTGYMIAGNLPRPKGR